MLFRSEFERVLHVPDLRNNLLSVLYLTRSKSYVVSIHHDKMFFNHHKTLLFTANITSHNAAILNGQVVPTIQYAAFTSTCPLDTTLWHRRFAHLNHGDVNRMLNEDMVKGMVVKSELKAHNLLKLTIQKDSLSPAVSTNVVYS